jgi:hypothetical protein
VDAARVEKFLLGSVFAPALFDGKASVAFNFQAYAGQFSVQPPDQWAPGCFGVTQEVELNIVVYPKDRSASVPAVTFQDWVMGDEQSKLMGNHRVHVPCDSDMAIMAGVELFGEPKFKTTFGVNVPSYSPVREPGADYRAKWIETWGFKVNDPNDASKDIFTFIADLSGSRPLPGNISSITEYGTHDGRPIACRWNILQPLDTYFLAPEDRKRATLTFGASDHPMKKDMMGLLGVPPQPPLAIQTFMSVPAAIQSRAVFI